MSKGCFTVNFYRPEKIDHSIADAETIRQYISAMNVQSQRLREELAEIEREQLRAQQTLLEKAEGDTTGQTETTAKTNSSREQADSGSQTPADSLATEWSSKAEENIERWGTQRHDTLILALIEEVSEIISEMDVSDDIGPESIPDDSADVPHYEGGRLLREIEQLGAQCQEFLERHYESCEQNENEFRLLTEPSDSEEAKEEISDAAALCWQLYWAIERAE